jgi:hypothetical protein
MSAEPQTSASDGHSGWWNLFGAEEVSASPAPKLPINTSNDQWWNRFADEEHRSSAGHRRKSRRRRLIPRRAVAPACGAVVIIVGVGLLLTPTDAKKPSGTQQSASPTDTSELVEQRIAEGRLLHMLPAGFASADCSPTTAASGAIATVECGRGRDLDGPANAEFSVTTDFPALRVAFDRLMDGLTLVPCPGGIQSPGPWHRNDDPQHNMGTLVCGFRGEVPTVAWTTDERLLMSSVTSESRDFQDDSLNKLLNWWSAQ